MYTIKFIIYFIYVSKTDGNSDLSSWKFDLIWFFLCFEFSGQFVMECIISKYAIPNSSNLCTLQKIKFKKPFASNFWLKKLLFFFPLLALSMSSNHCIFLISWVPWLHLESWLYLLFYLIYFIQIYSLSSHSRTNDLNEIF